MNKKINRLMIFIIAMMLMTSCVRDEEVVDKIDGDDLESDAEKVDEVEELEDLDTEEILDLVLNRNDERDNYRLKYKSDYYLKSEALDLDDLGIEDLDIEGIEIDQKDEIYHYQDGQGRFKTIVKREENNEVKEKIITYNKDIYIVYDSDMVEDGEDISIYTTWRDIINDEYHKEVSGFFVLDSKEEFEDFKTYGKVDYPSNPLDDCVDLLEIYNHSDMYRIKRIRDEEDDSQYVLNLISYEDNIDIRFYIDREEFYVKSYEGINGDAKFSGRIIEIEDYIDYDRDFFDIPNTL